MVWIKYIFPIIGEALRVLAVSASNSLADSQVGRSRNAVPVTTSQVIPFTDESVNNDAHGEYIYDGRTCCTVGDVNAQIDAHRCHYNNFWLRPTVPEKDVTKCCWNHEKHEFHVHVFKTPPPFGGPLKDMTGDGTFDGKVCDGTYKFSITEYQLVPDYVKFKANLHVHCGPYDEPDEQWLRVHFNQRPIRAGSFHYQIMSGTNVYVDITTAFHPDYIFNATVHITGDGILASLSEWRYFTVDNKDLKGNLTAMNIKVCPS